MTGMGKHTVLLIDDDEKLAKLLKAYFAKFNIRLLSETHPSAGIEVYRKGVADLVILDVMLPEINGFEVCRRLREIANTPILMLTARGDVNDRVVGLELGADDYVPKPFEPRELVVRIKGILARLDDDIPTEEPEVIQLGDLSINKSSRMITVVDKDVEMTTKEYALLLMMTEVPGRVFSRDDIMEGLGDMDNDLYSRSVDILVSRLRNKLKPLNVIETVWGVGYRYKDD